MELLKIEHTDFVLYVDCAKYDDVWAKAKSNIEEQELVSKYYWSEGVVSVTLNDEQVENGQTTRAIFFDNTNYPIWVEFKPYVKSARFASSLQSENEQFSYRRNVLAGFLNYGNEIGRSELRIEYEANGIRRQFTFGYEVLSSKLNYHEYWRAIVEDIEKEYRMLSLSYLRRTFHGFTPSSKGETPEIIWWSIFANEQKKFIKACKNIIDRPHRRLRGHAVYKRADQLTFIPQYIENELAEHRKDIAYLYRVEESIQTNDTPENRFLKFAIGKIAEQYNKLKIRLEAAQNVSDVMKDEMKHVSLQLNHLKHSPFFRTVGHFKGLNQESMVLQKGTGYSQVYRTWNLLRRAYSLEDGIYRLQTKDIATLYEIWCFIEVSHIIKERLHLTDDDVEQRNRMEMNGLFTWELSKGEHSRILFKKDDVELAELIYNPKNDDRDNYDSGIMNVVVPTVPQKPDIVLQLTKNDLKEGLKMTYLFDAKYRIAGKDRGVDVPPEDAINQMHRYRDAIYYKDAKQRGLKKEVIGGYILFPGNGEPEEIQLSRFYKSIEQVNIGAFPLRPKNKENEKMLGEFIDRLIAEPSVKTISKVIPQKGSSVEVANRVLVGVIKRDANKFENRTADLYNTGKSFPTTISLNGLHYFMPYLPGKGIRDVYKITRIRTITSKEIKHDEEPFDNDIRLAFEIKYSFQVFPKYFLIKNMLKIQYSFTDTTFEELRNLYLHKDENNENLPQ